jgi:hypothetical protein
MANIPQQAVERLAKLEQRVEAMRASYGDLQAGFLHARGEVARLEGMLQSWGGGRRVEVDAEGRAHVVEHVGTEGRRTLRYLDADPGMLANGRTVARLRREASDYAARRDALAERMNPLAQLATACRAELERRGWREHEYGSMPNPTLNVLPGQPITRSA